MTRIELLDKFLNMHEPVELLYDQLNKYKWDSNSELIILTRKHIIQALHLYISGEIVESKIEAWANAIESREDIGIENKFDKLIKDIMYELANPDLTSELTKKKQINL